MPPRGRASAVRTMGTDRMRTSARATVPGCACRWRWPPGWPLPLAGQRPGASRSPTSWRPARTRAAARRRASPPAAASSTSQGRRGHPRRGHCSAACCTSRPATRRRRSRTTARPSSSIPRNAVAYFNRGNVYDQMGEHDRAIADYTEAIKLDPTDPDIFNNRGQAYDTKGEYDLAIADYTQPIRLEPRQPPRLLQPRPGLRQQGRVPARRCRLQRGDQARSRATRRPT